MSAKPMQSWSATRLSPWLFIIAQPEHLPFDGSVWPVLPVPWVVVSGPALVGEGAPLVQVDWLLGGSGGI